MRLSLILAVLLLTLLLSGACTSSQTSSVASTATGADSSASAAAPQSIAAAASWCTHLRAASKAIQRVSASNDSSLSTGDDAAVTGAVEALEQLGTDSSSSTATTTSAARTAARALDDLRALAKAGQHGATVTARALADEKTYLPAAEIVRAASAKPCH